MAIRCSKCKKKAVTFIRYNGTYLCREHFINYVESRVKREIRRQRAGRRIKKIAVALSGGKDSSVTLYLIKKILHAEVHAITVNEGIRGYRNKTIEKAKLLCKELDVPIHVVSFKEEYGFDLDDINGLDKEKGVCTYCGILRRSCLNRKAKELGADFLATGHNLDDFSQSILMNFVNADLEKLARLSPHGRIIQGLVPRIAPLRTIPEKETTLYAILQGIDVSLEECPYALSSRGKFREFIYNLEDAFPGTRHRILQSYERIKPYLLDIYHKHPLNKCISCGEPTSGEICMACSLANRAKNLLKNYRF